MKICWQRIPPPPPPTPPPPPPPGSMYYLRQRMLNFAALEQNYRYIIWNKVGNGRSAQITENCF